MPRVSKKTREEAIELLRCSADKGGLFGEACMHLGFPFDGRAEQRRHRVPRLADDAFDAVHRACVSDVWWRQMDLEAAALLEDGWSPGDPVVRL